MSLASLHQLNKGWKEEDLFGINFFRDAQQINGKRFANHQEKSFALLLFQTRIFDVQAVLIEIARNSADVFEVF